MRDESWEPSGRLLDRIGTLTLGPGLTAALALWRRWRMRGATPPIGRAANQGAIEIVVKTGRVEVVVVVDGANVFTPAIRASTPATEDFSGRLQPVPPRDSN